MIVLGEIFSKKILTFGHFYHIVVMVKMTESHFLLCEQETRAVSHST